MKKEFTYRSTPSDRCPYLLETTPEPHYSGPTEKIIELILINRFGLKNIPVGIFWRQVDTSKEVFAYQRFLWQPVKRLLKTYKPNVVINMIKSKKVRFMRANEMWRYLGWCKDEHELQKKIERENAKPQNTYGELIEDSPVIKIDKPEEDNLLDWLDT